MKALRACMKRLAAVLSREQHEHELAAEMESLLQLHVDENIRSGMTPEQARRDAIAKLGGVEPVKQAYRERDRFLFLEHLGQDLRFSIRQLLKYPAFSLVAIVVLALGVGASVAIFAFVDAALIKPLPYPNPSTLVHVTETISIFPRANLSYLDYLDWKKQNNVFTSFDVFTGNGFMLSTPTGGELVSAGRVSDGFFRTLGVTPMLGRDFFPGEDAPEAPNTVMLSYAAWQTRFGGRKDIVGQTVTLSGNPSTIIGVLPRSFQFARLGGSEFFTTLHPGVDNTCDKRRSCHNLEGIARLKDGVSVQAALADTKLIAQRLEQQYPDSNRGQGATVTLLSEVIIGDVRPILLVLLSGAGLLLVIACVNVAGLLLVRSESRKREITIRGALGASPSRLIRQFVTEGLVLVLCGGVAGLAVAYAGMQLLVRLISKNMMANMPYLEVLGLNLHVVLFAAAISLVAAILFSVTPVLHLPFGHIREGLAGGGQGAAGQWRRFGGKLVVLELATAMVLLVAAGLLGKSFYHLMNVGVGFQPDHLATVRVMTPANLCPTDESSIALGRKLVNRVRNLPGVTSVAIASKLPVTGNGNTEWIRVLGHPFNGEHNEVNGRYVSSDYFATLRTRILHGRSFSDDEDQTKPRVVLINQALARQYFPGEDPIGKKMADIQLSPKSMKEIIGIVDDIKEGPLDTETRPAIYVPFNQEPSNFYSLMVRTLQDEHLLLPALSAGIHEVAPNVGTVGEASLMDTIHDSQTANLHRSSAWLVGGFAALALLLGVIGLYGVIAYSVSQRTREIGVRVALGAQRVSIYRLILKEAGWLTVLGVVTGLISSILATTLLRGLLFGVSSWDASTLIAVAILLGLSALLASFVPARRAASVDPMEALRAE